MMETLLQTWWIYALGAAFFAALTAIFAKIGIQKVDSDLATAIRTVVIIIVAWGIVFWRGVGGGITQLSPKTITFLVLSGLATGLSWICYFRALQLGPAAQVAALDKASLVLVVLFSALFLSEPLTWRSVIGVALIVAGTVVLIR
jgi:transporter family protein